MSVTIENLPIIFLIIVGIGMVVVLIGILRLASEQEHSSIYTNLEEKENASNLEDLFSFFLQEEEKKNQSFRELVMDVTKFNQASKAVEPDEEQVNYKVVQSLSTSPGQAEYKEIIKRYEMGESIDTIAKALKKGTGEVKLIISLYARR